MVGKSVARVNDVAPQLEDTRVDVVTYETRNFEPSRGSVNRLDIEANRPWLRYRTASQTSLSTLQHGGQPVPALCRGAAKAADVRLPGRCAARAWRRARGTSRRKRSNELLVVAGVAGEELVRVLDAQPDRHPCAANSASARSGRAVGSPFVSSMSQVQREEVAFRCPRVGQKEPQRHRVDVGGDGGRGEYSPSPPKP